MCLVKLLLCHIPRILENPSKYIFLLQNYHSDFLEQCFSNFSKYFTWRSPIIYFLCLQPLVQCVGAWVVESVCATSLPFYEIHRNMSICYRAIVLILWKINSVRFLLQEFIRDVGRTREGGVWRAEPPAEFWIPHPSFWL